MITVDMLKKARVYYESREFDKQTRPYAREVTDKQMQRVFNATLAAMQDVLEAGDIVLLPGLGSLRLYIAAARLARNPRTGAQMNIPERLRVKFSARPSFNKKIDTDEYRRKWYKNTSKKKKQEGNK